MGRKERCFERLLLVLELERLGSVRVGLGGTLVTVRQAPTSYNIPILTGPALCYAN
jgi:hypothetical protein